MMYCADCELKLEYVCSSRKADLVYNFYQCPQCGKPDHTITYFYTPYSCPLHVWEHMGMAFRDGFHSHALEQINRCVRCGAIHKMPQDLRSAGLSGRVEVDDPRVKNRLLWNKSAYTRLIPKSEQDGGVPAWVPTEAHVPTERELEG